MKIHVANYQPDRLGGGWTFARNFVKGLGDYYTPNFEEADLYFIPGPTMVSREDVEKAKATDKRIVLRIDNAVRNSRNRNTGMSRMKEFAQAADLVIYQSDWAQQYLSSFTDVGGRVVLNSADEEIFNTEGRFEPEETIRFLYSRFNRDETKNWEMARYYYSVIAQKVKSSLMIVGQFSPELIEGHFDFYNGESYNYVPPISDPRMMAKVYKACDRFLYSYYNDACSNTLIEALCCGMEIDDVAGMLDTGGAAEIMSKFRLEGAEFFRIDRMVTEYLEEFAAL